MNRNFGKRINRLNWDCVTMCKENGGIDFSQLYGFNLVMLGKKSWKFTTNNNAIISRVFKVKIFPNDYFLGTRLCHNLERPKTHYRED